MSTDFIDFLWKQFVLPKRWYSTLWNIQNWHKLSKFPTSPPLKKIKWIYTDLKNDQDNGKKRGNPRIRGKLSSLSYMDTILKLTIGVNLTFTLAVEPGTRRIPSVSKQCFSKNPIIWRKERDLHESVSLTYTIRFIFDQLDKNRWWSIKFTIDIQ